MIFKSPPKTRTATRAAQLRSGTSAAPAEPNAGAASAADALSGSVDLQALSDALSALSGLTLDAGSAAIIQTDYLQRAAALWNDLLQPHAATAEPAAPIADRRFAAPRWSTQPSSAFTAQLYLLNARTLLRLCDQLEGNEKTRQQVRFAVQQWIDASAPSNYLALNPEAQRRALETNGRSISAGLQHLWNDLQQGHVSQTDESGFEVGRNVATTEGAVVFENELFQLLEYSPLTAKVHARPMLLVPPCINKYYILDLQPDNSLIRYTVMQGHRVFVMSWRNGCDAMAQFTWDQYIDDAVVRAIAVTREISGADQINTLGFCIGGTLLATALAVLAARGEKPAASMTLLTTLLDFSDTGVLDLFIDEAMVRRRETSIGAASATGGGLLKGQELASTFSMLRPNDLVWNYVVGNYLMGEAPPPFDLLYWNSDGTNLPGPMYCWYLRHTYLENRLMKPGDLTVCGQPLNLLQIGVPAYVYASREDHIVPWDAAYRNTQVLATNKQGGSNRIRFVLGASGHIAGVINPPAKNKRSYWVGATAALPADASAWLDIAVEQPGSWWTDWSQWAADHAGTWIAAPRRPGSRRYAVIEPAPGRYVKQKA